ESAHGTNPASAQMVGLQVVVTKCDAEGNVDLADLTKKCEQYSDKLACVMITYPSTYGLFDTHVKELCAIVHPHGRRGYVDGAKRVGAVSAAPLGNAAVLPISWMYMRMMGADGLTQATETAILSANYIAARLGDHYDIHFSGNIDGIKGGGVAHECILDLRPL